jgi:hypothetical protein
MCNGIPAIHYYSGTSHAQTLTGVSIPIGRSISAAKQNSAFMN